MAIVFSDAPGNSQDTSCILAGAMVHYVWRGKGNTDKIDIILAKATRPTRSHLAADGQCFEEVRPPLITAAVRGDVQPECHLA